MTERENALKVYNHEIPEWIPLHFDAIHYVGMFAGNETGMLDFENHLDCYGIPWVLQHGQPMPLPGNIILEDISDWRDVIKFPNPKTWDWEKLAAMELENYDSNRVLVYFCEQGMFDRLVTLMTFEEALISLVTDPEECSEFFGAVADYKIELIECVAKYINPDVFMYTDDYAKSDGLLMKPEIYRELLKPHHKRIIQAIKDNGMIAEQHTCGKFDAIAGDYAEIGIQSIFPAQSSNDLVRVKKLYGDKMVISGGFNTQGDCARLNAPEEIVRVEARRMIDSYAKGGGYIAYPLILGQNPDLCAIDTLNQKVIYEEFKSYGKDFYNNPENRVF